MFITDPSFLILVPSVFHGIIGGSCWSEFYASIALAQPIPTGRLAVVISVQILASAGLRDAASAPRADSTGQQAPLRCTQFLFQFSPSLGEWCPSSTAIRAGPSH